MMSIKWCGQSARSANVGFAVPMSIPRYTKAESTLMISMGRDCASAKASAVLPEAVGPSMNKIGGLVDVMIYEGN